MKAKASEEFNEADLIIPIYEDDKPSQRAKKVSPLRAFVACISCVCMMFVVVIMMAVFAPPNVSMDASLEKSIDDVAYTKSVTTYHRF
jgi:hypothetical protein